MLTPGFAIRNDTIWSLQISLNQVGPLYYDVIKPGETFVRDTGAVWFTIKAAIFMDEKDRITDWDVIIPIGAIVGTVILAAATAGAAAYAGGPALAAAGMAGTAGVTGLSSASALATATAASALIGAGFSASTALIAGGVIIGGTGAALTATATAALKNVFSNENSTVSSAGEYAGPPWPFRRDVELLAITGGPSYRREKDTTNTEIYGTPLRIAPAQPKPIYASFGVQCATPQPPCDDTWKFLLANNRDLVCVKTRDTGTRTTEIHILDAAKGYQEFSLHTGTALHEVGDDWDFLVAPNRDLVCIKKRGTGSKKTEVHVLTAESQYTKFHQQTHTALHETDANWVFAMADNRDIVALRRNGANGRTETHVITAASRYLEFGIQTPTALGHTDANWSFSLTANRDLFAIKRGPTGTRSTEVHVLSAASEYRSFALQTGTALHETDATWAFAAAPNRDVVCVKQRGGVSGKVEVHVLRG